MFEQPEELKEKKGFEPLDGDICFLQSKPWYGIDSIFIYRSNPKATQPCSYMHYNIQLYDSSILEGYICTEDCIDFIRLATKDEIMFLFEKLRDQRGEVWNEELKKREKISPIVLESFKINWEQRRYEIAKEAINAILSNSRCALDYNKGYYKKDVVGNALSYADELIKELKTNKLS